MAKAQKTKQGKNKVISGSYLKSQGKPKAHFLVFGLVLIAIFGGLITYRALAVNTRTVIRATDAKVSVVSTSNPAKNVFSALEKDGATATVLSMAGGPAGGQAPLPESQIEQRPIIRYVTNKSYQVAKNTPICAYIQVLNPRGETVSHKEIKAANKNYEINVRVTAYGSSDIESTSYQPSFGGPQPIGSAYYGIGNYTKYCTVIEHDWVLNRIDVDHPWAPKTYPSNPSQQVPPETRSILKDGYKIRLLKFVIGDNLGDAAYSKNPYQ